METKNSPKNFRLLKHENVLELIGVCIASEGKLYLVTELMDTDLRSVAIKLPYADKLDIIKGICRGMYVIWKPTSID
jgi:serine/threonine protein kinase